MKFSGVVSSLAIAAAVTEAAPAAGKPVQYAVGVSTKPKRLSALQDI